MDDLINYLKPYTLCKIDTSQLGISSNLTVNTKYLVIEKRGILMATSEHKYYTTLNVGIKFKSYLLNNISQVDGCKFVNFNNNHNHIINININTPMSVDFYELVDDFSCAYFNDIIQTYYCVDDINYKQHDINFNDIYVAKLHNIIFASDTLYPYNLRNKLATNNALNVFLNDEYQIKITKNNLFSLPLKI